MVNAAIILKLGCKPALGDGHQFITSDGFSHCILYIYIYIIYYIILFYFIFGYIIIILLYHISIIFYCIVSTILSIIL